jgi:hypothetical protein
MGEKRGIKEFCFCRHQLVIFWHAQQVEIIHFILEFYH